MALSHCVELFRSTDLAGSALWAVAYLLIIRRGFLDRTCGVPLPALIAAISWELIFAVLRPTPELPPFVVPTWLAIDSLILYQYLRFGPASPSPGSSAGRGMFHARFAAALAGALALEYAVILDRGDRDGVYSGFAVNVVMSLAFIAMLDRRRDARGQSMYVAISKLGGSALTIPHAYALHGSLWSLRAFMGATLICDVTYAVLLHRQCRLQGIRPWARL